MLQPEHSSDPGPQWLTMERAGYVRITSEVTQPFWPQTHPLGVVQGWGLPKGPPGLLSLLSDPALVRSEGAHPQIQGGVLDTDSHGQFPGGSLGQVSAVKIMMTYPGHCSSGLFSPTVRLLSQALSWQHSFLSGSKSSLRWLGKSEGGCVRVRARACVFL